MSDVPMSEAFKLYQRHKDDFLTAIQCALQRAFKNGINGQQTVQCGIAVSGTYTFECEFQTLTLNYYPVSETEEVTCEQVEKIIVDKRLEIVKTFHRALCLAVQGGCVTINDSLIIGIVIAGDNGGGASGFPLDR